MSSNKLYASLVDIRSSMGFTYRVVKNCPPASNPDKTMPECFSNWGVLEAVIVEGGVAQLNELMELGKKHFKWVPFEIYISPAFPNQAFILWQKSETVHERRNGCIMIAE